MIRKTLLTAAMAVMATTSLASLASAQEFYDRAGCSPLSQLPTVCETGRNGQDNDVRGPAGSPR